MPLYDCEFRFCVPAESLDEAEMIMDNIYLEIFNWGAFDITGLATESDTPLQEEEKYG